MRLVIGGGGTGGHVYPALAVAAALRAAPLEVPVTDLLYVGTPGRAEQRLAPRAGIAFYGVSAGAVRGRNPLQLVGSLLGIIRGTVEAWSVLGHFGARAVFVTGGYVSVPLALAAWLRRVPLVVFLPDVEPGLAVRALAHLAAVVAVTAPLSVARLPRGKAVATGYPIRMEFTPRTKAVACARWGIDPGQPVLLVLGGSLGARRLNRAVAESLELLLGSCQVIHICGPEDGDELAARRAALSELTRLRYHVFPYLDDGMADALAAADLVVARSGASVLGEFTAMGVASVLVPYPHAGNHQEHNARYLAEAGAALVVREDALFDLVPTVLGLLRDRVRLAAMAEAARALARPDAAAVLARLVAALGAGTSPAGALAEARG